jgi:hydroxymethylpyrimidine/phosphomethylpyrimidine kinase
MGEARGRVLTIAGSDSGGGAGIQADVKTITALGGYAMTAITAVTAQNTRRVFCVEPVSVGLVRAQIEAVLDDIGADAIKIGMLGGPPTVSAVADVLRSKGSHIPIVLDPVMAAKDGRALLEGQNAVAILRAELLPMTFLVTPNAPEAEALCGISVHDMGSQQRAGEILLSLGAQAALVKGGHIPGDIVCDLLVSSSGVETFKSQRRQTRSTHGTGCTLSAAIAALLAQGVALSEAVGRARTYLI